jgi:hypothetical protein
MKNLIRKGQSAQAVGLMPGQQTLHVLIDGEHFEVVRKFGIWTHEGKILSPDEQLFFKKVWNDQCDQLGLKEENRDA